MIDLYADPTSTLIYWALSAIVVLGGIAVLERMGVS